MKPPATRSQHLFILRLWCEPGGQEHKRWRGSVEHIPGHQVFYFTSMYALTDFISLHLEAPAPPTGKGGDCSHESSS